MNQQDPSNGDKLPIVASQENPGEPEERTKVSARSLLHPSPGMRLSAHSPASHHALPPLTPLAPPAAALQTNVQQPWSGALPPPQPSLTQTGPELSLILEETATELPTLTGLEALQSMNAALPLPSPPPPAPALRVESLMHTSLHAGLTQSDEPTLVFALPGEEPEATPNTHNPLPPDAEPLPLAAPSGGWALLSLSEEAEQQRQARAKSDAQTDPSEGPASLNGALLAGRYRLEALVGVGGMGSVYRARDLELDERVALKLLRRDKIHGPGVLARFRQEVKLARRITHRNIARMFDLGEHDGKKFLTMEFVEGETLATMQSREPRPSLERVLTVAIGVCEGLRAAHEVDIIHRDLKPENVMVQPDGRVVITDFGIAWPLSESGLEGESGSKVGTPTYMAPEQVEDQQLSPRTDLYALGELLYQLLTGQPPWQASTLGGLLMKRLQLPPPNPADLRPELPSELSQLIVTLMATRPEDRPASAQEVLTQLMGIQRRLQPTEPAEVSSHARPGQLPLLQQLTSRAQKALESSGGMRRSLAVLPLKNQGMPEDNYLADGLTEDLLDSLSMVPELRLLSRHVTRKLGDEAGDPLELGRKLGVHAVLDGSLRRRGEQFRLSLRLTSTQDGIQFWAHRYDGPGGELLVISEQVAQEVTRMLQGTEQPATRQAATNPKAIELYLKARQLYHGSWSDIILQSQELFAHAHALAPQDPQLMAGYALALARRFVVQDWSPGQQELCQHLALRAQELAPNLGEAPMALAWLYLNQGEARACGNAIQQALRASPGLADGYDLAGQLLLEVGEVDKGSILLQTSLTLEPRLSHSRRHVARTIALQGRVDEAIALLDPMLEPPETRSAAAMSLSRVLLWHGRRTEARQYLSRLAGLEFSVKNRVLFILETAATGQLPPDPMAFLEMQSQSETGSVRVNSFLHQLSAEVLLASGHEARALQHLREANRCKLMDLFWLDHCPLLTGLRSLPEFEGLRQAFVERRDALLAGFNGG